MAMVQVSRHRCLSLSGANSPATAGPRWLLVRARAQCYGEALERYIRCKEDYIYKKCKALGPLNRPHSLALLFAEICSISPGAAQHVLSLYTRL